MNRSSRRVPLFERQREYVQFLRVLAEGIDHHPVELLAFCVMPNHWHLVVRAERTSDLSTFMHWISATHAGRWHRARGTVGLGPVYKGRFLSVPVTSPDDLVRVCRYVERNPLRAGIVRVAQQWPWSSLSERARRRRRVPLLSVPFLESGIWTDYVNVAVTSSELAAIERLETGRP